MIHQHTAQACIDVLKRAELFPLAGRRVADVGCGAGTWLLEFAQWGADPADLAGVDLMTDRIACARRRLPQADLRVGSATALPWPDDSFDLASQMLMFENLLDPDLTQAAAREMLRIVKPGGGILWFDLRIGNPRNPAVRGIGKQEIRRLFPGCQVIIQSAVLAPPLTRLIAPRWRLAAEVLSALPFLRSHYAALIRKPAR